MQFESKTISFPDGETAPALGLGTWRMGERAAERAREVAAISHAIDVGYRLIDTAEMYGEGGAEEAVGAALAQHARRDDVFIVSKVYPHNASRKGTIAACERSLKRLGREQIDLYLLHWRGSIPLADTVAAFHALQASGKIMRWGVSNFDVSDVEELFACGGEDCATNQVYFSPSQRGAEFALLPWMNARKMPMMAYSPVDQGALVNHQAFANIGARHNASATQAALAWVMSRPGMMAIPKAVQHVHIEANFRAQALQLTEQDLAQIDAAFPAPTRKRGLAML
jgi:diketogulonate reductase-like aldo/keto reductase